MGKRGPAPKPTAILRLTGSWRANHRQDEPQPEIAEPTRPIWLTPPAKREWARVVPGLLKNGVLSENDRAVLTVYCQAVADVEELRKILTEEGWTIIDNKSGTEKKHPIAALYHDACVRVRAFGSELGLSPSARTRVVVEQKKAADPLGSFAAEKDEPEAADA